MNRIHWPATARYGEIQVKEFDLEQTADAWVFLDLDASVEAGEGDRSTTEVAVRAAASIADKALGENRAVGLSANGHRLTVLPADRGARQRLKILQLLAAVEADGRTPLAEALVTGVSRLRRGMTAIVITASLDPSFVRPLATLRESRHRDGGGPARPAGVRAPVAAEARIPRSRASAAGRVRHALAEFELPVVVARSRPGPRGGPGPMIDLACPPPRGGLADAPRSSWS